ncbi:hypothetical protein [Cellvibrio japonicus]|uniref:Uncharacterized protein n=1 Tax=Cellvibrio japonicus (strain Ueda107) TaxID=498211 RepID=B3PID6_CELJU|nr:hypothetical protein [Cellvibrio japonicus]ACE83874.1 hypothetical protein CJA_2076 [Cellvibrio japonicus Ueda107]QEI12537.1 hypothetical protein FY117_10080 [Cellvibrio japonicus]QEI16111.1 hypothetical protein FY116_10085 [Cellvibrio japonicus]QEI19689.1 hypothetical protein FY115_10080 [Cellvibrio japonicus]
MENESDKEKNESGKLAVTFPQQVIFSTTPGKDLPPSARNFQPEQPNTDSGDNLPNTAIHQQWCGL